MYTVKKCTYQSHNGAEIDGYIIDHEIYPYMANKYLHKRALHSSNTAKQYAYRLCCFFNYLENNYGIDYLMAESEHLENFLIYIQFIKNNDVISIFENNKSGFTIAFYLCIVKSFYQYLESMHNLNINYLTNDDSNLLINKKWDNEMIRDRVYTAFDRGNNNIDYIKWYTEEQIEAIFSALKTYRDKAIFSLSLDGLRIDEVLSTKMKNYKVKDGTIRLNRSKGKETGSVANRLCVLSSRSIEYIENYLYDERYYVEENYLNTGRVLPDEMFLNLKKRGESYGQPVGYHNYIEILKNAAERAGLPPERIRTHSGRSTKASELFRIQSKDPAKLTDNQILDIMGWKRLSSANPYKNRQDKETAINNHKILMEERNKRITNYE